VIEPRNTIKQGKDDAVRIAEINTKPAYEGESVELPRGHRAWHVGHCEHVGTREALNLLHGCEYAGQPIIKGERQTGIGESDGAIVPVKAGNAAGGKGATSV